MNTTLMIALWRQRLSSPLRLFFLFMLFFMPMPLIFFGPQAGLAPLGNSLGLTLVLVAGAIGQDISSGTLQMLLARPVSRASYVLSRWLAAASAASAVSIVQALFATAILVARGFPPTAGAFTYHLLDDVQLAFGVAAVMVLFSSLLSGFGDLAILGIATVTAQVLNGIGTMRNSPLLQRCAAELQGFLTPQVDLVQVFGSGAPSWFAIVSYASTVTLCIALAIVVMNERELSYASAG